MNDVSAAVDVAARCVERVSTTALLSPFIQAMLEADRDREMVDVIVKKIEAEERAEQEQYLKSR